MQAVSTSRYLLNKKPRPTLATSAQVQLVCSISAAAGHDKPQHPESAGRVLAIQEAISQSGLSRQPHVTVLQPPQFAAADINQLQDVLQLVHPSGYLARLQEICASLTAPTMIDDSTYISPGSYVACCEVGQCTLLGCASVITQPLPTPPPGPVALFRARPIS